MKKFLLIILVVTIFMFFFREKESSNELKLDDEMADTGTPIQAQKTSGVQQTTSPRSLDVNSRNNPTAKQSITNSNPKLEESSQNQKLPPASEWILQYRAQGDETKNSRSRLKYIFEMNPSYLKKLADYKANESIFLLTSNSTAFSELTSPTLFQGQKIISDFTKLDKDNYESFCRVTPNPKSKKNKRDSSTLFMINNNAELKHYPNNHIVSVILSGNLLDTYGSIQQIECFHFGDETEKAKSIDLLTLLYHLGVDGR